LVDKLKKKKIHGGKKPEEVISGGNITGIIIGSGSDTIHARRRECFVLGVKEREKVSWIYCP